MAVTRAKRVTAVLKCENTCALRPYRHRIIEADKRRRAARKARNLEASRKAQAKMRRPRRDEKLALLLRLLDAVLEVEPGTWHATQGLETRGRSTDGGYPGT
ncbi:unnamed protein product [Ectocarpus sp. 12 AP-2014]